MALVQTFQRAGCSSALISSTVFSRRVAHTNSTASQTHGAAQEVKPYEDIPGPKGIYNWPVIGPMFHFKPFTKWEATTSHLLFNDLFDKYGPIFKLYLGQDFVMVFDPKDIETVFRNEGRYPVRTKLSVNEVFNRRNNVKPGIVDLEGKEWQALRAPLNKKLMKVDSAGYYLKPQNVVADEFVQILATQKMSPDALAELFFRYAVESISVVCFNTRLGFLEPKAMENQESARLLQASQDVFLYMHKSFTDVAHRWFRNEVYRGFEKNKLLLGKQTMQHIKDAQLVLETRKQNGTLDPDEPNLLLYLLSDSSLDFMDIVGIMESFYIAGTDSTAKNLQILFFNLAKNPDKQETLRKEITSLLGHDGPVTAESLAKLPYLKACLKESFRLFSPTVSGPPRKMPTDVVLSGYRVPAGTVVSLHTPRTCQKYFLNPDKFIPERWIRSSEGHHPEDIPPTASLPFGYGPRNCIGRRFAEQEIYLAAVKVLQKLKIDIDSDSWNTNFIYTTFIQPEKPIKFRFSRFDD
ncbi:unnamed protein product [Candidula unifasciata]|uniref:Cytochrome P450 n=1 Tax=Candidula unifasciata TaxID=100452 RepID=A0A8S3ZQI6_9EUPU|nr:unnamed protein product [Candidula unifasciata]